MDRWSNCSAPLVKVTLVPHSTLQRRGSLQRAHSITGPLQVNKMESFNCLYHDRKIYYQNDENILSVTNEDLSGKQKKTIGRLYTLFGVSISSSSGLMYGSVCAAVVTFRTIRSRTASAYSLEHVVRRQQGNPNGLAWS